MQLWFPDEIINILSIVVESRKPLTSDEKAIIAAIARGFGFETTFDDGDNVKFSAVGEGTH